MMGALINWLREEWRLMRLKTWATEYQSPAEAYPFTSADPRVAHTLKRLEQAKRAMYRRRMRCLLRGKEYTAAAQTDLGATFKQIREMQ